MCDYSYSLLPGLALCPLVDQLTWIQFSLSNINKIVNKVMGLTTENWAAESVNHSWKNKKNHGAGLVSCRWELTDEWNERRPDLPGGGLIIRSLGCGALLVWWHHSCSVPHFYCVYTHHSTSSFPLLPCICITVQTLVYLNGCSSGRSSQSFSRTRSLKCFSFFFFFCNDPAFTKNFDLINNWSLSNSWNPLSSPSALTLNPF